ncbi:MAG: UvrD-helicase domain-containing protein, partial [Oscillospiraceae bacterium]|nr:UvrD-helicase domain-containing protein [Oscillospiraceae bacterium]
MDFKERYIKARRAIIKKDFSRLNDMQFKAAMTTEGALLILAGAGSGKTTVLINRIANLLKYGKGYESEFVPEYATEDDLKLLEYYATDPIPEFADRVQELCAVEPVEPWRVIAITFTNKAANELKARLESFIGPEAGDVWAMTFHSACVRILRRDIDKLGYDRAFTIYDT